MELETTAHEAFDRGVSAPAEGFTSRAELDAFIDRWLPRVYRFAARRTPSPMHAEAVVRSALATALREGLARSSVDAAPRMLALTKSALARARAGVA